jgi:transposase-like protein
LDPEDAVRPLKTVSNRALAAVRLHLEQGLTVKAIAQRLGVSPRTVKAWLDSVRRLGSPEAKK